MEDTRSWAYRLDEKGEVESRIFASKPDIPEGWVDTPAKLKKQEVSAKIQPEKAADPAPKMPELSGMEEEEAKRVLDEWAESIGIKLDRRKKLANMLTQLEQALGNAD